MRMASGLQFVSDGTNGSSPDPGTGSCVVARIDRTGNLRLLNARGVEDWKPEFELTGSSSKPLGGVAVGTNSIVYVGNDGRMAVAFGWGQLWHPGVTIGDPCAPPGAGGGVMQQTAGLLTAGVIGNDGRIWLSWVVLGQNWNGPVPFGDPVGVPGGAIALGKQNSDVGVAVFIGTDRRMWVASVDGTNGWNAAVPFGNPVAPPGAPVALGASSNGLIALVVGDDSRMNVAWVADNNPWQGPVSFGQPIAQPGADITCLGSSAAVIGSDGRPLLRICRSQRGSLARARPDWTVCRQTGLRGMSRVRGVDVPPHYAHRAGRRQSRRQHFVVLERGGRQFKWLERHRQPGAAIGGSLPRAPILAFETHPLVRARHEQVSRVCGEEA